MNKNLANKTYRSESMSPITFKITYGMLEILEEIVKSGGYANRAELIREAIDDLLYYESLIQKAKEERLTS